MTETQKPKMSIAKDALKGKISDDCYFCGKKNIKSANYGTYTVNEAVKPPRTYKRWRHIGYACDDCGDRNVTQIDKWGI